MSPHGTRSRYTAGCRCDECREAQRVEYHNYKRRKALARWGMAEPMLVDSTAVKQHIQYLMAHGMGYKTIAKVSGVAETVIERLAGISSCKGHPAVRVRPSTERKILAVEPTLDNLSGGALIPAGPTVRRVQSLVAIGHSVKHIAERIGKSQSNFHVHRWDDSYTVTVSTARLVAGLYDELSMVIPPDSAAKTRALNYARKRGWPPPLAWDDIDAGDLAPDWSTTRRGTVDDCATCDDIEHLASFGEIGSVIAARLGMSVDTFYRHLERHGRLELRDRFVQEAISA